MHSFQKIPQIQELFLSCFRFKQHSLRHRGLYKPHKDCALFSMQISLQHCIIFDFRKCTMLGHKISSYCPFNTTHRVRTYSAFLPTHMESRSYQSPFMNKLFMSKSIKEGGFWIRRYIGPNLKSSCKTIHLRTSSLGCLQT